jgi:3-oxosteroid 1-dehydrogenase
VNVAFREPVTSLTEDVDWDATADVVVVGGGVAGFSTAISAADLGASVILVEKAAEPGGTTRKASAGMMVPNNRYLRELGKHESKEDFARFLARVGRPLLYDASAPCFGLPQWEYDLIEAWYDNAAAAFDRLDEIGALKTVHQPGWSSYNEVAEDVLVFGRQIWVARPDGSVGDGKEFMRQMLEAADRLGISVRTEHRVGGVFVNGAGEVVGLSAESADGPVALRARKAVVFASGGFTHNADLCREYLGGLFVPGCAAQTSEGDFIPIVKALGLPLINMHAAWGAPVVLEHALDRDPRMISNFSTPGDGIFAVNKFGVRVGNEKTTYNDRTRQHFPWDPHRAEYPNYLLFPIWDERNGRLFARVQKPGMESGGNFIPQPDDDWRYILRGDTLEELAAAIDARLAQLGDRARGVRLEEGFAERLRETFARYNEFARAGSDPDFHRGETAIELHMHGERAADNDAANPTMFPLSETGPYFATILAPGSIETKGGPKVNARLQVLDHAERPVPGLYGVGNCVASASGESYWSGGSTFGPYITFGYIAARCAVAEPVKEPVAAALSVAGAAR